MTSTLQQSKQPTDEATSRRTRERRAIVHIALPGYEIAREVQRPRESIAGFLRRTGWARRDRQYGWQFKNGLPTICILNGEAVLRKNWRRRIAVRDEIKFVSRPLGGQRGSTGKQVVGLVALIAVVAFAAWAGPAIISSVPGLAGSTLGSALGAGATALIGTGGSLLVNSLEG